MADVVMATLGLSHTADTNVGSALVKGVSGGERKRVSIAEILLSRSSLQCWDNSTRGLDSANALEFCKSLKTSAQLAGTPACVAIYQASQDIYDVSLFHAHNTTVADDRQVFDKVIVLYDGRQIYFGYCNKATEFFTRMGFKPASRQTTTDFLTSLTSPAERSTLVKPGFEHCTPRTAQEFSTAWKESPDYAALMRDIDEYEKSYPMGGLSVDNLTTTRRTRMESRLQLLFSPFSWWKIDAQPYRWAQAPYTLSVYQQMRLCASRGFLRLKGDASVTISGIVGNTILALVVGMAIPMISETGVVNSVPQDQFSTIWKTIPAAFTAEVFCCSLPYCSMLSQVHSRFVSYDKHASQKS